MTNQTLNSKEALDVNVLLDTNVTRALEQSPQTVVPLDFAARVCASLPPQRAPRKAAHIARTTAFTAAVVLVVAMFLIAPHAAPTFSSVSFDLELLVLAQLCGIAYWLVVKQEMQG